MKNPGKLVELEDGRKAILYNNQPLLKSHNKVVLHLIGDDYKIIEKDGKPATLLRDVDVYNDMVNQKKIKGIGMVD